MLLRNNNASKRQPTTRDTEIEHWRGKWPYRQNGIAMGKKSSVCRCTGTDALFEDATPVFAECGRWRGSCHSPLASWYWQYGKNGHNEKVGGQRLAH